MYSSLTGGDPESRRCPVAPLEAAKLLHALSQYLLSRALCLSLSLFLSPPPPSFSLLYPSLSLSCLVLGGSV